MKYSHLAPILTALNYAFGEHGGERGSDFQEECAGRGCLTTGLRLEGIRAERRDVPRLYCYRLR